MPAGKGYKVTSKDQLGKGMAKKRTKQVEKRKASNKSSLSIAQKYLRQNGAKKL
jgi:hypothetical protein